MLEGSRIKSEMPKEEPAKRILGYFFEIANIEIFRLLLTEGCTNITFPSLIIYNPLLVTSTVFPSGNTVKTWSLGIRLFTSNFESDLLNCNKLLLVPTYKVPLAARATDNGPASMPFCALKTVKGELSANFEMPLS